MNYTKADIKKLGICPDYTDERLDELAAGRESLSARELAELDIPINDRLWLLGRLCVDDRNTMARRIARDVLPLWRSPVLEIVTQYLDTGDPEIKLAAEAASFDAWSDAWSDSDAAARAASDAVAWAASDAARAASAAAIAASAAAIAASAAARTAAKQKYLGWMVEFCESREKKEKENE